MGRKILSKLMTNSCGNCRITRRWNYFSIMRRRRSTSRSEENPGPVQFPPATQRPLRELVRRSPVHCTAAVGSADEGVPSTSLGIVEPLQRTWISRFVHCCQASHTQYPQQRYHTQVAAGGGSLSNDVGDHGSPNCSSQYCCQSAAKPYRGSPLSLWTDAASQG
jgi:hypothetical protein